MQAQRPPSSLRIPSEDNLPLFDPSGLGASLSADDWQDSFDLSSVAAARLGITSPARSSGLNDSSFSSSAAGPSSGPTIGRVGGGGIDGRSSFSRSPDQTRGDHGSVRLGNDFESEASPSVTSKVRIWWQRGAPSSSSSSADEDEDEGDDDAAKLAAAAPSMTPPRPQSFNATSPADNVERGRSRGLPHSDSTQASQPPSTASPAPDPSKGPSIVTDGSAIQHKAGLAPSPGDSQSPTVRSPAADFLSAFSSLHSVASPSSSVGAGSLPRHAFNVDGRSSVASSSADRSSAAASLYGKVNVSGGGEAGAATVAPPRPDEQGAKFGPGDRYVMGRMIGFGGFSTVREGYDVKGQAQAQAHHGAAARRVAVKIVYNTQDNDEGVQRAAKRHSQWSHELEIWRSLPAHPHLLPLLHSEVVTLPTGGGAGSHASDARGSAELLVMPFCDRGNLLDYVRSEGGQRGPSLLLGSTEFGRGTPRPSSLSRSASLNTSLGAATEASKSFDGGRATGSGFLSRSHRQFGLGRAPSASGVPPGGGGTPWALNPSQLQISSTTSNTSSPATVVGSLSSGSGLLRRASSQMARSRGVPIKVARETMRQLASALHTLHVQADVLHSDLKLENVLGQGLRSRRRGGRGTLSKSSSLTGPPAPSSASSASSEGPGDLLEGSEDSVPCWRIADFGLARRIASAKSRGDAARIALLGLGGGGGSQQRSSSTSKTTTTTSSSTHSRGGSLAYTAPEFLRAKSAVSSGSTTPGGAFETGSDAFPESQPSPSPFAADMWALGCILYALLSGKLPFSDSFEPRLQMKIAKAQWEIPPRLRRRAERLADASRSAFQHAREASGGSLASVGTGDLGLSTLTEGRHVGPFGRLRATDVDMSASLPSLSAAVERPGRLMSAFEPPSDHVVGSVPSRADHVDRLEINASAKAMADAEVDPESDDDDDDDDDDALDAEWDGLSWDRAAAREVLHGLLEPEPEKRWTIERLCASAWLHDDDDDDEDDAGEDAGETAATAKERSGAERARRPDARSGRRYWASRSRRSRHSRP